VLRNYAGDVYEYHDPALGDPAGDGDPPEG